MAITESTAREVMTKKEQLLKKKLIALLRDDGKGHRHAKYAERLEDFLVKIVNSNEDPEMTAAVSFDDVTIYISDGFLKDPETFFQLNVLMRHELAHYLMQHQIRMMHKFIEKYGEDGATRIKMSYSIHHLMNIIEDFEISNTRYSEADKIVVRNMLLNCRLISGLVTEDIRSDWKKLNVIEMFDSLNAEINQLNRSIIARWQSLNMNEIGKEGDFIHGSVKHGVYFYNNIKSPTNFLGPIDKFIKNQALYHFFIFDKRDGNGQIYPCIAKFSSLETPYQEIIKTIYEIITTGTTSNNPNTKDLSYSYTKDTVKKMITQIAQSSPLEPIAVYNPSYNNTAYPELFKLYTPEEKLIAIDTLKAMLPTLEHYQTWYDKVTKVMGDTKYSTDDLEAVLSALK